jgi:hypothetical protein
VEVPTDEHLKRYKKRLPKPEKSVVVATTKERNRFREHRNPDDSSV